MWIVGGRGSGLILADNPLSMGREPQSYEETYIDRMICLINILSLYILCGAVGRKSSLHDFRVLLYL